MQGVEREKNKKLVSERREKLLNADSAKLFTVSGNRVWGFMHQLVQRDGEVENARRTSI